MGVVRFHDQGGRWGQRRRFGDEGVAAFWAVDDVEAGEAQEFTYSLEGKRLKSVEETDIECWLGELGRNGNFESWQLVQAHESVHFLLTRMLPNSNPPRPSSFAKASSFAEASADKSSTPPMEGNSDVPTIDWDRLIKIGTHSC